MKKIFYILIAILFLQANIKAAPPTNPATNLFFDLVDGHQFRIRWTNGNGARRIVIAREGAAVTAVPTNGIDYNASPVFGSGDAVMPSHVEWKLYNMDGKIVAKAISTGNNIRHNISALAGVYVIEVSAGKRIERIKLVKQ